MSNLDSPDFITSNLPGIGGEIKQRAEDFVVEEQLTYDLTSEGEHFFVFIETLGIASSDTAQNLAKLFSVDISAVTYISDNDKFAVSRQIFSIHLPKQNKRDEKEALDKLAGEGDTIKILWTDRHETKLKPEYIEGNCYVIRVRKVSPMDVFAAKQILELLEQTSLPSNSNKDNIQPKKVLRDPDVSGGVDEHGSYIRLSFEIPREVKIDKVLQELMKL